MSNYFVDFPVYGKGKLKLNKIIEGVEFKICLGVLCNRDGGRGVWKPLGDFNKYKDSKDGRFYKCRDCRNHKEIIPVKNIKIKETNGVTYKLCIGVLCSTENIEGIWKTLDNFTKSKNSNDGYFRICKGCKNTKLIKSSSEKKQERAPNKTIDGIIHKICFGKLCKKNNGVWKPLEKFNKCKETNDGYSYTCKNCKSYDPIKIQKRKEREFIIEENRNCKEKTCKMCKLKLSVDMFHKKGKYYGDNKPLYVANCKECTNRKILKKKPIQNPNEYRDGILGRVCAVCNEWKTENECYKFKTKRLISRCIECFRIYQKNHRKELKMDEERYIKYKKMKSEFNKTNTHAKISGNLRRRMRSIVSANVTDKTSFKLVGIDVSGLKRYLESKFQEGMTWDNYGTGWHIDHIIPCAAFDLTRKDEQLRCFNYHNLQPLWSEENLIKGDKYVFNPVLEIKLYHHS